MIEQLELYWPFLLLVLVVVVGVYLLLRPRQRVRLTDSTPVRPHMAQRRDSPRESNDIAAEAAAAASDVTGEIIEADVHRYLANNPNADDFLRMKGVGPKFAYALHAHGFDRFEQLARLTPEEIERIDRDLGPFSGRITRDRVVEQAAYLARGDVDGYEQRFGKL